ncbi:hypothetical protein M5F04_11650 [Acinetobacter sp. ANC 7200]|uniref:hypothetical protein n=1 Tax=Acinetobacter TaxID=469 RepID=UPI0015D1C708|nr:MULTISPECIES: hypothetical protein [Acinetobacter]MCL6245188.1 hypothetical protein [Acinetobacter amyesii]
MTTIYKSITTEVDVDVDIEIEFSDVCEFIDDCDDETLESLVEKISKKKVEIKPLYEFDPATIRHLIERANVFGLADMLDDLKREGERFGAYLMIGERE